MASSSNPAFANPAFQEQRPGLTPPAAQTQTSAASAQEEPLSSFLDIPFPFFRRAQIPMSRPHSRRALPHTREALL